MTCKTCFHWLGFSNVPGFGRCRVSGGGTDEGFVCEQYQSADGESRRLAILAALKSSGRLDVAADAMTEFDERAGTDRQGGEDEVSSDVPRLGASNHRKD